MPGSWQALGLACLLSLAACAELGPGATSPPLPVDRVTGVSQSVILLDGTWRFQLNPPPRFWETGSSAQAWRAITVPGEPQMQGFNVVNDREFAYERRLRIPADFAGQRVFVRFQGIYGEARVWVNGHFLRNHLGSFTPWECELTNWVKPGEEALLSVGVTDRADDISGATGYAKHCIGGILRSVSLLARPQTWVRNLQVETPLTADFRAATLSIAATMEFAGASEAVLRFSLRDPQGRAITLWPDSLSVGAPNPHGRLEIPVESPQLWDAEHPRLYTLTTRCVVGGKEVSIQAQAIGFRQIKIVGSRMLINGQVVRLRGACRHDMHPTLGRVSTPEYEEKDVLLAKEANINFFRTSHYPPTENFLRLCDEQGIYVESESAVCFNQTYAAEPYASKLKNVTHDPAFTPWYLGQVREMVESFRDHPSVIIWSAGNESRYGVNIGKSLELIRELDGTRPCIFAFSKTSAEEGAKDLFDLCSIHYPSVDGMCEKTENQVGMTSWSTDGRPSIGDEWAHVPCYCKDTLKNDPGIQDFWGEGLSRMWTSCYDSQDTVGGAIWGYVDEVFQLPDRCVGYGPWGIVDIWRRRKPEFWNTKKAYSPVHLLTTKFGSAEVHPELPIQNRYNHTNLSELTIRWKYEGQSGSLNPPSLAPRARGRLLLPALEWRDGTILQLDFVEQGGRLVDTYNVAVGSRRAEASERAEAPIHFEESATEIAVGGAGFSVTFDKSTGLIREARRAGETVLTESPRLNISGADELNFWSNAVIRETLNEPFALDSMKLEAQLDSVRLISRGRVGERSVVYVTTVHGNGRMTFDFKLTQPKALYCEEVGLAFVLGPGFEAISWERNHDLWTSYPDDHIGRPIGRTPFFAPQLASVYRQPPVGSWSMDSRDYYLYGPKQAGRSLTRDVKSLRAFIRSYVVSGKNRQITVQGTGREGARIRELDSGRLALIVDTGWDYLNLGWGNYQRGLILPGEYSGQVKLDLGP
jgi:beta-galactosidase